MKRLVLLFAAGFNLMLLQLLMVRELSIPLFCTELAVLLVTLGYFSGHLVGYLVYRAVSPGAVRLWLAAAVLLHLPMIAWVRVACALLARQGLTAWSPLLVFAVASVLMTSFYAVFLPRVVEEAETGPEAVARAYSVELAGSLAGLACAMASGEWFLSVSAVAYLGMLLAMAWALETSPALLGTLAGSALAILALMPGLDTWSANFFYNTYYDWFTRARVIHSEHTPYQKIDVLEEPDGKRSLYLNGLEYFSSTDLEQFNFYLSGLPGSLKRGGRVLIVGSGSMSSLQHLAPHASQLTTVEIDERVAAVGRAYFERYNRLDSLQVPWRLVVDDAKHYLANTEEQFDLIIVDVPAPYYLQTGLLFTREFYRLAASRLAPEGVLSAYLAGWYEPGNPGPVCGPILAAVNAEFEDFLVVNGGESRYSFVLAGSPLPFGPAAVVRAALSGGRHNFRVFSGKQVQPGLSGVAPAAFDNLGLVWALARP